MRHRLRVVGREQTAAHEHPQQPLAHLRLHLGDGGGIEAAGGMKDDPARGGLEHAVDDHAVEVQVGIEVGAEAVDEGHGSEPRRGARTGAARAQAGLHRVQEQPQGRALQVGVALQEVTQALGYREHPLPQRQVRQHAIGQMRCGGHHAPRVARGAHAAPLAGERDQEIVAALPAPGPGKAMGEDAAFQVTAELPLHVFRHRPLIVGSGAALGEPSFEVLLDAAIEHACARPARPIPRRCALPGPALGPHARPRCAALRRRGSGWAVPRDGRHWPQG